VSSDQVQEQQNEKARKKRHGLWLTLGLLSFLFLAVPAVFYLFFSMRAARLVEAELTAIRADGLPATPEELNDYYKYPPVDKDATRLWLAGTKMLRGYDFSQEYAEFAWADDNGVDKTIPPPGTEWEDIEAAEKFLAKYAASLDSLHQASQKGGAARYPIEFRHVYDADVDSISQLHRGAQLLSMQAHVRAHRRDARGAAESIHAIFMLERSLANAPVSYSQTIRTSISLAACEVLGQLLPHVEFSGEDIATLRADLRAIDYDAAFREAIVGDRALGISAFLNPAPLADDFGHPIDFRLGARNDDMLLYLRFMGDYLAAAEQPWPERYTEMEALEAEFMDFPADSSAINSLRYAMTTVITPSFEGMARLFARHEATIRAADTVLAITQFTQKHDRLPSGLNELVPDFVDSVPLDPFDGKPLRYVVRETEYVIYSVGPDRVDDGGRLGEDEEFVDVDNPDLVFRVRRVEK